jgi:hypothetical protein
LVLKLLNAREDFARNGLGHLVTVYHSDVCQKKEDRKTGGVMANLMMDLAGRVDGVSTHKRANPSYDSATVDG